MFECIIYHLCSDLVPAISFVGSAGGILTIGATPAAALGDIGTGGGGGRELIGATGTGGGGGGVLGIEAAAAGAGGGGAAAATGAGAAASFFGGAAPAAPTLILSKTVPGDTVDPSSTNSSSITPDTEEGTCTVFNLT